MRATRAAVLLALLAGCGDGGGPPTDTCPEGHSSEGLVCVPIFDAPDTCGARNEMPVLGGGCRAVGVTQCATGFVGDGEGGCEPILPPDECLPGTMPRLGETECQPVGVTQCATGFVGDGEGGCEPILPPDECPPGTIEVIGFDTCQPLGDCGPEGSRWGRIETDGTTVYVDAAADATGADGTGAAPFPTITAALAVVEPGGQVAVAAGEYLENVVFDAPVRLEGRCAARVTIRGVEAEPTLHLTSGATGSTVRGVSLTGPGEGLRVTGAAAALQDAEIRGTGAPGALAEHGAVLTARRVRAEGCAMQGLLARDATLRLHGAVARGTLAEPGTGRYGPGVAAECTAVEQCGVLEVERSLLSGNRRAGIYSGALETGIRASVVQGTLPRDADRMDGEGIVAECPLSGPPCPLVVEDTVVSGNVTCGILAFAQDAAIRGTVIRDTGAQASDGLAGQGLAAACQEGVCGSLTVEESRVAGNRAEGILAMGVAATVRRTVVTDTWPQVADLELGRGIEAFCAEDRCGRLRVEDCLLDRNQDTGVLGWGVEVAVVGSVVRDTRARASDLWFGRGIAVQHDPDLGVGGNLLVDGCLVERNQEAGISAFGTAAVIRASVVRDTEVAPGDPGSGRGVLAQCHGPACEPLRLEGSLVSGNRRSGVAGFGPALTLRGTVVRDNLPGEADLGGGRGLNAQCDVERQACGELTVEDSLVAANHEHAIFLAGPDLAIRGSVIRDTRPRASDDLFGRGVEALCEPELGRCGVLTLEDSLVDGCRDAAVVGVGRETTIRGSVIRDTRPRASDGGSGRGIEVQCDPGLAVCGSLVVERSLVARSGDAGIFIQAVPAWLDGVAVVDSGTGADGAPVPEHGEGVWAQCDFQIGICYPLYVGSSQVARSRAAGVAVVGVEGGIYRSAVDTVLAQAGDGQYGYGLQVGGWGGGGDQPVFVVEASRVHDARLAGVFFFLSSHGQLRHAEVHGGEYCVALNEGTAPEIGEGNDLACEVASEPAWVNLYPVPSPPPATPAGL